MIAVAGALICLLVWGAPAQAYWSAIGSPPSQYVWLDATSNAPSSVISAQTFNGMVDAQIAAGQEMFSASFPADLSAQSTTNGVGAWDALSTADAAIRTEAIDAIGAEGAWAGAGVTPAFALGAGAFYVGWQIGTAIDYLVGIDGGTGTSFGGGGVPASPASGRNIVYVPAGTDLSSLSGWGCPAGSCVQTHVKTTVGSWVVAWNSGQYWVNEVDPSIGRPPDNGSCDYAVSNRPPGGTWVDVAKTDISPGSGCLSPSPTTTLPGALITKVYVIPAQTANVPGPGQSQPASVTQTTTTSYTGPNEAGKRANAIRMLTDPTYDPWQRWYCQWAPNDCGGPLPLPTGVTTITIPAITPGETYGQYAAALQRAGVLGKITDVTLSDAAADPSVAPYGVVSASPSPGTAVAPQTDVAVYTNPASTPTTPPGGGAPLAPTLPGIAIPTASTPCSVFPFGLPCWLVRQLSALSATPVAPSFTVGMPAAVCGSGCSLAVDLGHPFGADLSSIMGTVRPILLFASFVGLVVWFAGMAMGGSTGGGGSGGEDD